MAAVDSLQQLADAYGVERTLDGVADAIIRVTSIHVGTKQRVSVTAVVSWLIQDDDTITALKDGDAIPAELVDNMIATVERHGPPMRARSLVDITVENVRSHLQNQRADSSPL